MHEVAPSPDPSLNGTLVRVQVDSEPFSMFLGAGPPLPDVDIALFVQEEVLVVVPPNLFEFLKQIAVLVPQLLRIQGGQVHKNVNLVFELLLGDGAGVDVVTHFGSGTFELTLPLAAKNFVVASPLLVLVGFDGISTVSAYGRAGDPDVGVPEAV